MSLHAFHRVVVNPYIPDGGVSLSDGITLPNTYNMLASLVILVYLFSAQN